MHGKAGSLVAIRHAARAQLAVVEHLLRVSGKLSKRTDDTLRTGALRYQLDELAAVLDWDAFTAREQRSLRERIAQLAGELEARGSAE